MRALCAIATIGCLALAGCGGESGDLMAIEVDGGFAKSRGTLDLVLANDGRGTCNDGPSKTVPSEIVIEAREVERDLNDLAEEGARLANPRNPGGRFVVRIKAGTVRWDEGAQNLPQVLGEAQLLALRLDRLLCRGQTP